MSDAQIKNFIAGEFCLSQGNEFFVKYSPYTGLPLAQVVKSEPIDLIVGLQAAKKAQPLFEALSLEKRSEYLLKFSNALEAKAETVATQEGEHQGLSKSFVLQNSVLPAIRTLRLIAQDLQKQPMREDLRATGIVGIITPWCLSLKMVIERLAPALAAGNAVVLKVSEQSPVTTHILGEIFQEIQLPAGVVTILNGDAELGAMLAGHPGIRAVTAAGSQNMMESVAKAGLPHFKKLQLGGASKNGAMILADTDVKKKMPEIMRAFLMGQAQMCWNISRLFVLESMLPAFTECLIGFMSTLKPATSADDESLWRPLISKDAVAGMAEKISLAKSEHGKVLFGGAPTDQGFFHQPTILVDVTNCSVLQQDEVRGPMLLVTPVKYSHEMAKWANTSYLAQGAVVWGPVEKVQKFGPKLECAQVWENSWMTGAEKSIFGHKQSSFGNLEMAWDSSFYSDVKKLTGV